MNPSAANIPNPDMCGRIADAMGLPFDIAKRVLTSHAAGGACTDADLHAAVLQTAAFADRGVADRRFGASQGIRHLGQALDLLERTAPIHWRVASDETRAGAELAIRRALDRCVADTPRMEDAALVVTIRETAKRLAELCVTRINYGVTV